MTRFLLHRHGVGGAKRFGTACRVLGASLCAVALVVGLLPTLAEAADASRKGFAVVDASGVQWKGDVADIDLFAGVDAARPGSSGTYVFSVENGNDFPVECTLSVAGKAVVDGAAGEESLGLEYRLRDGGGAYLAGADDAWVAEGELYRGTMAAESGLSGLQLEWRWPLDASDAANAVDTSLASGDAPQLTLMLTARAEGEGNPDAPDVSVPSDGVTDGEGNPIPGADVTVNPDGSVDVVLPPGYEGDVKVEIVDPDGNPVPGVDVTVTDGAGNEHHSTTGPDGAVTVPDVSKDPDHGKPDPSNPDDPNDPYDPNGSGNGSVSNGHSGGQGVGVRTGDALRAVCVPLAALALAAGVTLLVVSQRIAKGGDVGHE